MPKQRLQLQSQQQQTANNNHNQPPQQQQLLQSTANSKQQQQPQQQSTATATATTNRKQQQQPQQKQLQPQQQQQATATAATNRKQQLQPQQQQPHQKLSDINENIKKLQRILIAHPNNSKIKNELSHLFHLKLKMEPRNTSRRPSINITTGLPPINLNGGQAANTAIQYMELSDKAQQFPKYSTTIKQYLFETLPELKNIQDRQEKRKKFVELLHKSLLSTCDIKSNQQNKITDFMKNSFPTGLLEQDSQTPTRENKIKGQGMLERVEKLNTKTGINISRINAEYGNIRIPIIIPFIPLDKDGNNQLDKIIQHMKNMGGFLKNKIKKNNKGLDIIEKSKETKFDYFIQIHKDSHRFNKDFIKIIYPSINDSTLKYIKDIIYKINITYANSNIYYSQTTSFFTFVLISIYINYGIQYFLDYYKKMYIIFSVIENFYPPLIGTILFENKKKDNYSLKSYPSHQFFSFNFITNMNKYTNYTNEEIIKQLYRYYYYIYYFYNSDVQEYYNKYGLIFLYFSLYIPDLIYYISDNTNLNKEFNPSNSKFNDNYKNKIKYLFELSSDEVKRQSINVIDEFMPIFRDYIKNINTNQYSILSQNNIDFNINKLYLNFVKNDNPAPDQINKEYYTNTNHLNKLTNSPQVSFQEKLKKLIELITEPVKFESNEKAIATISGIPAKFDKSLVSSHFFAFEFNLDKIKEVCSKSLMKYSKADSIQFIKANISNFMSVVKSIFHKDTDIYKYFVEIQIRLIKEGFVFASQEINTLVYMSRLFGSSFDSILEIFYQSFPYFMFCFEYVAKIAYNIYNIRISPCQFLNELFNTIGLEKMIILYKYLNITNIEIMEYIKKYGIIFLIYALLTPFHIYQTELTGKNITSQKQIIINKLKAIDKFEIVKNIKPVFDNNKIVEFIQKVKEKKNDIFGKIPLVVPQINNSNINSFNVSKFSNNGIKYNEKIIPSSPAGSNNETKGQNADFIWSVFTVPVPV